MKKLIVIEVEEPIKDLSDYICYVNSKAYLKGYIKAKGETQDLRKPLDIYSEGYIKGHEKGIEEVKGKIQYLKRERSRVLREKEDLEKELAETEYKRIEDFLERQRLEMEIGRLKKRLDIFRDTLFTKEGILEVYDMYQRYLTKEKEIISFREFVETYVKY
jgi:hypothetical protein